MRNIGIWLDSKKAAIVSLIDGRQSIHIIKSAVDFFHLRGGSRSKVPYGPQENVSEHKFLDRKKHQRKDYLEEIAAYIQGANKLYILGPADSKVELEKLLKKSTKFAQTPMTVETADSMTQNQIAAKVRDFFHVPHSWS